MLPRHGTYRRTAWAVLWSLTAACSTASEAVPPFVAPLLDDVPAPAITGSMPAPATWPAVRYEQPPRLLVLTTKGTFLTPYQRIARRLRGTVEARYLNGSDAIYHVNDKWIEPKDNPTGPELTAYARQVVVETVRGLGQSPRFDVVFLEAGSGLLADPEITAPLLDYLRLGGVVVAVGNFYPESANALAAVWPAQASKHNSWHGGGATHGDGPELAGVPTERLTGWTWIPKAEAASKGRALATGESGSLFAATVGKGMLLYCPTGPMSRRWDAMETVIREYDHDEVWLRFWDQVLYEVRPGSQAFPAYVDKFVVSAIGDGKPTTGGQEKNVGAVRDSGFDVSGVVVNRTAQGALAGSVHVVNPLGMVVYQADVPVTAPAGTSHAVSVSVPVAPAWGAGLYRVYLTLGDKTTKKQLHQALGFAAVPGTVKLDLTASRPGYRLGEEAQLTVAASSPTPWEGKLLLGIYDFRGRLLGRDERAVNLNAASVNTTFAWRVADHGVRVDTYHAVVAAVKDAAEWARAEATFDKHERWNVRNEYQWSAWAGLTCQQPSTVLPAMRLMGHAGMNSLGYPGRSGLGYAAERWGWRYYNEGIGINTFSPVIEYENDAEIEAAMQREAQKKPGRDLTSAALVLASVGEEAGFKTGWGRTYYWDTPVAPDKACRAFQWYLKSRYPDLARLNATWRTNFKQWEEVKLTKEFSGSPEKYLEKDGWAHPKESPLGEGVTGVSLAPYSDTQNFYAWYYDRIIAAATRIYRQQINPVSQTVASAPASWIFDSRECGVKTAGPGGWNESQTHSRAENEAPTFALVWGHFDWLAKDEDLFWGFLMQRTGHNDYWWDALMFNGDMTHTRATMALRRWTARLAGHEQAILDSRLPTAEIGILGPNGLTSGQDFVNMNTSLAVALMQGGFDARTTTPAELGKYKIVFAVGRQALSADDAAKIQAYVEGGGTLVFTPRFGSQDEFGGAQAISPGHGLSDRWGLRVDNKLATAGRPKTDCQFALDGVAAELKGHIASDSSPHRNGGFREGVTAADWTVLASYPDGTPALLKRSLGKGRLVYLNAVYASHHYIQFRTPTDASRQGFFKLVEWLCRQAGARQSLRLEGDLQQVLHVAVKQSTDPTGRIRYVILKNSIEAPWVLGRLHWQGGGKTLYDVLTGERYGTTVPFQFRPNQGRWFAAVEQPVKQVEVKAEAARMVAGEPLRVRIRIVGDSGQDVAGEFPLTLKVSAAGREIAGLRRSFSRASGGQIVLPTALNDPAGSWTVTVTDGITGLAGQTTLEVSAAQASAPAMRSLGWPSELAEPQRITPDEFLDRLQRLAKLYQTDQSQAGGKTWLTKQMLGAFYDWFPNSRHAILRPLHDVDWPACVPAWRVALEGGATFVLTGEDLGVDPGSGLAIYPHADARQFTALAELLRGATWHLGTHDGQTLIASLGKGRLILCRESIDAAGHTNADAARWQQRWLSELAAAAAGPVAIAAPDEAALRRWWTGAALTKEPRTVTWFGGNQREVKLAVDPAKPLDSVFTLVLPPEGDIKSVDFSILATAKAATPSPPSAVTLDVGCDGTVKATLVPGTAPVAAAALLDWPRVVNRYLSRAMGGPVDDNGCQLVPVRVHSTQPVDVTVREPRIVVLAPPLWSMQSTRVDATVREPRIVLK